MFSIGRSRRCASNDTLNSPHTSSNAFVTLRNHRFVIFFFDIAARFELRKNNSHRSTQAAVTRANGNSNTSTSTTTTTLTSSTSTTVIDDATSSSASNIDAKVDDDRGICFFHFLLLYFLYHLSSFYINSDFMARTTRID